MDKFTRIFIAALGYATRAFLALGAAAFAVLCLCAFISIFDDAGIIGVFGTAGSGVCAWLCWIVKNDIPVK